LPAIGRYEIHDLLGAGGMATVHLGRIRDADRLAPVVAIKRLHAALARDPASMAALLDEARLASRVRHPNAAAMLEVFEEAGEVVLVMEYVEGESLARLGKVPVRIASAIACDVLDALHAAHEARDTAGKPLGLVHRDVSPQNILVGSDGLAHLVDFGIARAAGRQQVTRDGSIKGKVGYLPPESLHGQAATRAADIYATAAVLWEMLAGRRLFDAETEAATVVAALGGATDAPSVHAPDVTKAVDDVIMRGLARQPHARFPTARAMGDALRAAAAAAGTTEVAAWLEERASDALRRRRAAVAAIRARSASSEGAARAEGERSAAPARRDRRRRIAGASFAALAIAGASAFVFARGAASSPERAAAVSARGSLDERAPAITAGPVGEAPPAPTPDDVGAAPSSATPSEPPRAPTSSAARSGRGRGAPSPATSARRDCDPPYTLDGHRKVLKPGCL
jgi:hypothetical protein